MPQPNLTQPTGGGMYKNQFLYEGINLGSKLSIHDDAFKALQEGREKAKEIAKALSAKIPGVTAGDIEIHLSTYDPQFLLDPAWLPKKVDRMSVVPGRPTLKSLNVSAKPKREES